MPANCPGDDARSSNSSIRRASSNVTINSTQSQSQIFTDRDMLNVSNDTLKGKATKRGKIFGNASRGILITKNPQNTPKSGSTPSTPSTPSSIPQTPPKISTLPNQTDTNSLTNSTDPQASSSSMSSMNNTRRNQRSSGEQTLQVQIRTPHIHVKPDRRKDIKITNCQEKDGIWTATGQFGRESRHSKRAEITYDKKKFRFIQKDDQGNKHVFEIPTSDVEGNDHHFSKFPRMNKRNTDRPIDRLQGVVSLHFILRTLWISFPIDK